MQHVAPAPVENSVPLSIRPATDDDWEFFVALDEQTTWDSLPRDHPHRHADGRRDFAQRLRASLETILRQPGHVIFVAWDAACGERAGLLWFGPRFNPVTGEDEAWIYNLTVQPEFRGRGIARELITHAENHAREVGFDVVGLAVASHNDAARTLYEKCGYEESNVLMRKSLG